MGQCCTIRSGAGEAPAARGFPERWAGTQLGPYGSSSSVPTVRMLSTCYQYGKPQRNNLYLGNSLAATDGKMMELYRIKKRIEICTKRDLATKEDPFGYTGKSKNVDLSGDVLVVTLCPIKETSLGDTINLCYKFIQKACEFGQNILIHSKNRKHQTEAWSIAIACGCLMKMHAWTLDHALYNIKMQSPDVELSFELGSRLQAYEQYLRIMNSTSDDETLAPALNSDVDDDSTQENQEDI